MPQPHKMAKHTRTIRRQQATNCLGVFDHVLGLALLRVIISFCKIHTKTYFLTKTKKDFPS